MISTAATTFSTRPVIEIVFGVSRDSIRPVARGLAHLDRGARPVAAVARARRRRRAGLAAHAAPLAAARCARPRPRGAARANASLAAQAEIAGDERAERGVDPEVVGGDDHDERDDRRVD